MTTTDFRPRTRGIIDVMPEEIDDFELQVRRFQAGEFDETEFLAYRLKQGVYGQRQSDVRASCAFQSAEHDTYYTARADRGQTELAGYD